MRVPHPISVRYTVGLTADEVSDCRNNGYDPRAVIEGDPMLRDVLAAIAEGRFSPDEKDRFGPLLGALYDHDYFLNTADFSPYVAAQADAVSAYRQPERWWRSAVLNTAGVGWFSSERSIREYDETIWHTRSPATNGG